MPGIVLILIMVFLVTLWIMGAYVDVKTTHKQNGHHPPQDGHKTEIVRNRTVGTDILHGQNIEKGSISTREVKEKARENVSLRGPSTLLSMPATQAPQEDNPSPDPVNIPRERMRVLRTFREEEPGPESEEAHDTLIPDSLPENTGNSPGVLDSMVKQEFESAPVNHRDESIQTDPSLESNATQTDSHSRDIGVGAPVLTEDKAIQVAPEKQDASTGEPLLTRAAVVQASPEKKEAQAGDSFTLMDVSDVSIQASPERKDQSMQAVRSHHDVSLGSHISQHEQGIQHDLSTHSIGLDPSRLPGEDKSIQVFKSLRDVSLQNSLLQESKGVGSHLSYSSKAIEANPENQDQSVQHPRTFKSIGLDPRSFHASDFSPLEISEKDYNFSPLKFFSSESENSLEKIPLSQSVWVEEENSLDKIPLSQSVGIEEEHKQPLIKKSPINLSDLSLAESIDLEQKQSLVESVLISDYDIENQEERPSLKSIKSPVKSKKKSQKDSESFEMISHPKRLHPHSSWELLEDEEK